MLVLAGPGSGKTTVLIERIRYLTDNGIVPDKILVITFSKKAAKEMQQRFIQFNKSLSSSVNFGTFHAVFFHILKQYDLNQTIISRTLQKEYVKSAARRLKLMQAGEDDFWCQNILAKISRFKNMQTGFDISLSDMEWKDSDEFQKLYMEYSRLCKRDKLIDYDDIIENCLALLNENPKYLLEWRQRYQYILVDEFQDSNRAQYEIVRLLAGEQCNLFAVGDEDQSIYGFRGAYVDVLRRFLEETPSCRHVILSQNYRCSEEIVRAASSLIGHNKNRLKQIINKNSLHIKRQTAINIESSAGAVEARCFADRETEADFVVKMLKDRSKSAILRERTAVLYRMGGYSGLLEEKLRMSGILYTKLEPAKEFYEEEWVVDILAYLKISIGVQDRAEFCRVLNKPLRGLSRECLTEKPGFQKMLLYYEEEPEYKNMITKMKLDCEKIAKLEPFAAVNYILKGIGYEKYMRQKIMKRGGNRELAAEQADEILSRSKAFESITALLSYVDDLREIKQKNKMSMDSELILQTIHGSKGLEYDTVYLVGLQEGMLPHKKAITEASIEEERRLMYVAMTRAKKKLYLCAVDDNRCNRGISRFVKETGLTLLR